MNLNAKLKNSAVSGPGFVHLRVRSVYSLLEGALPVNLLAKLAVEDEQPALAICDNGNLFGALEFCTKLSEVGVQPIIGMMLAVKIEDEDSSSSRLCQTETKHQSIALFAQNEEGYRNLMMLSSESFLEISCSELPHVPLSSLEDKSSGLIVLTGGPEGPINAVLRHEGGVLARKRLERLQTIYGERLYVEVQRHGLKDEVTCESLLLDMSYEMGIPLVASNDVFFPKVEDFEAQQALLCIAEGQVMSEGISRLSPEHHFKSRAQMIELFSDLPEATDNTVEISRCCSFWLRPSKPLLPKFSSDGVDEQDELIEKAREGLAERLNKHAIKPCFDEGSYRERLNFELEVIGRMRYSGYFLIVADFIGWAKKQSIPVGPGRGSGAGSLVAWSLGITELDPMRFGLLFERFLNPERVSMPDFDVDFCQYRRDEVINYVQYRYGAHRVAQIITFGTLQARAVLRDVGRVLEMRYGHVDALCKLIPNNPAHPVTLADAVKEEPRLLEARLSDPWIDRLLRISLRLEGLYRHASTHAAGVVIGENALKKMVPLYRDHRASMPVTQFNMKWVEQAGLVKFDFLGLKTLTIIDKTIEFLKNRGVQLNINSIPIDDVKTYAMLSSGETIGVFQVESVGMRDALKRMNPDRLEDIIALVALYRPGPMNNIPTYCARKHGKEKPDYMHPKLEPILRETYGVIIYQEQVMQIAQVLSGYSLGRADLLRRAMGKKIKKDMKLQHTLFIEGAVSNGIDRKQAQIIFELVARFADYGFNKSHAAAYALIAYQTAYLKANYPVEFLSASMTCDMNNTDKLHELCREAKRLGIRVLPPAINSSDINFMPGEGEIHYALSAIKTVGRQIVEHLVYERNKNGPWKDLRDFAMRIDTRIVKQRVLKNMAAVGVFDEFDADRGKIIANAENILSMASSQMVQRECGQEDLFGGEIPIEILQLQASVPCSSMQQLSSELELIGFFLTGHPLDDYMSILSRLTPKVNSYVDFAAAVAKGKTAGRLLGIIEQYQERRSRSGKRYAFVVFSDPTAQYNAIIFSDVLTENRELLKQGETVVINVEVDSRETEMRLKVQKIETFEKALQRAPKVNMQVICKQGVPMDLLADLLATAGMETGSVDVIILLNQGHRQVKIKFPGKYNVGMKIVSQIKELKNIVDVCFV